MKGVLDPSFLLLTRAASAAYEWSAEGIARAEPGSSEEGRDDEAAEKRRAIDVVVARVVVVVAIILEEETEERAAVAMAATRALSMLRFLWVGEREGRRGERRRGA